MVGTLDQLASQIDVAGFCDAELRISIAGLATSRSQAQIATDVSTSLKALLASQAQHIGKSRDVAHTEDLQQCLCLRLFGLSELLNLPIVLLDLDRHLRDLFEHRTERLRQTGRHGCQAALCKTPR
jgi:hypothetical protein